MVQGWYGTIVSRGYLFGLLLVDLGQDSALGNAQVSGLVQPEANGPRGVAKLTRYL